MGITLSGQLDVFLLSCAFGAALGAYYDVFRLLRLFVYSGKRQLFFQDVFYFFSCGVFTFLFALAVNSGEVRFFLLAGEAIGWLLYHLTLGALTYHFSSFLVSVLKRLAGWVSRVLFLPVGRLFSRFGRFLRGRCQKAGAKLKKKPRKSKRDLKEQENLLYNANKPTPMRKMERKSKKRGRVKNEGRQKKQAR